MIKRFIKGPLHPLRISRRIEVNLLKRYLGVQPGDTICDIGCGDGYWSVRITGPAHTVGIDIDPPSLDSAKANYDQANMDYTLMSAEEMGFPDNTFDKIFGVCSVEHIPNNIAAWKEFGRCLKSGGVLALTLDSLTYPSITDERRADHHRKYFTPHLYDLDKVKECLAEAGLTLTDHRFIISSPISMALYLVFDRIPRLQYLTFPISYPITLISDALWGSDAHGWKLGIRAVKS